MAIEALSRFIIKLILFVSMITTLLRRSNVGGYLLLVSKHVHLL